MCREIEVDPRIYISLILVSLLLSPEDLQIVAAAATCCSADWSRRRGEDLFRRFGEVGDKGGEESEEDFVVIGRQEEEEDYGESEETAGLQTQLGGVNRLDGRLEGELEMLEGTISDECRLHRLCVRIGMRKIQWVRGRFK